MPASADVYFTTDSVAWLWYYDKQGCIQAEGLNFVQDLPSFLVLLYAFQRMTLKQWGLNVDLDFRVQAAHQGSLKRNPNNDEVVVPTKWDVTIDSTLLTLDGTRVLHSPFGLIGRGTVTIGAHCPARCDDVVVKIYWPGEVRTNEADIIRGAREQANGEKKITSHLPDVIACRDFQYRTGRVRDALGLEDRERKLSRSRLLRVIVFPFLEPITTLPGKEFIRAWLECVRCECPKVLKLPTFPSMPTDSIRRLHAMEAWL